jgi:hypothetical protein
MHTAGKSRAQRWLTSSGFLGALLGPLSVRDLQTVAIGGLDPSWKAAIHIAARGGRNHGSDLVFTYGPLGFLTEPILYYPSTALLSYAYSLAVQVVFAILLVRVLRRNIPLPLALFTAFLLTQTAPLVGADIIAAASVFLLCMELLRSERTLRSQLWLVRVTGLIGGLHLLIKLSSGLAMAAMFGLVCLLSRDRRVLAEAAAAIGSGLIGGWLLSGNQLADLPAFVLGSAQLASGYSEAMGLEDPRFKGDYLVVAYDVALICFLAWSATRDWRAGRRLGAWIILFILLFSSFKQGFVRHDGHQLAFFFTEIAALGAFVEHRVEKFVFLARIAASVVLLLVSGAYVVLNPLPPVAEAWGDARVLASSSKRVEAISSSREDMKKGYGLEPQTLDLLRSRSFHVYPWESGVAWAYPELRWSPLPVFQAYVAYTPRLDELNSNRLRGAGAPERILREQESIDSRNPDWESPAAMLALVCNYVEVGVQTRWQVLAKAEDRCAPAVPLAAHAARAGEPVPIPQVEGQIVLAKISDFKARPSYALRTLLWHAPVVEVVLDSERTFRIVPGTAGQGLIVRSPDALGYSPGFALQNYSTITLARSAAWGLDPEFRIEFVGVPVTAANPPHNVAVTSPGGA